MYRAGLGIFFCAVLYAPLPAINFNLCVKRKRKTPSTRVGLGRWTVSESEMASREVKETGIG